ncbi:BrnT family toxin [Caulobacter sp. S45]|uniref:BrnT family toxin n=1 Tax=Caulobacter sp. S45 TaxID=1641861 RepID=UPI0015764A7C|nr:BrnT family toxin [Caulobacter sp. S45]
MQFEWDNAKAQSNLAKHGVGFSLAARVFDDPNHQDSDASREADGESRRKAIGSIEGRLIAVVYVGRGEVVRIISARRANMKESRSYGDRLLHA